MLKFDNKKIYNSCLIETKNFDSVINSIYNFLVEIGFDRLKTFERTNPDIITIKDDDKEIQIERIRNEIIDTVNISPRIEDRKVYIIYDAINLSELSQNTLLKTVEEPPQYVIFFILTSNINFILDTLRSRCINYVDSDYIDLEKIKNLEFYDDAILILSNILYNKPYKVLEFSNNFTDKKYDTNDLINIYSIFLRDVIAFKKTMDKNLLYFKDKQEEIITLSSSLSYYQVKKLIDNLSYLSSIKNRNSDKGLSIFNFLTSVKNIN